ncbi:hypothetical protein PRIPAC_82407 [Pristionchus pacificus]|uniref:G protein-coupled receptor n=1 Tax=Pristionchus pacificus TaxID=54126 RepID=A0A2A6CM01_PRIPA|nr:hypothetical protein PRIPAC_82407 [Pristionchus pacificus]|eukprot:PDM79120.1 G protein-coupled receptor [Pristionchus pacificus]
MQLILDPIVFLPVLCGTRDQPLLPIPGSFNTYLSLCFFYIGLMAPCLLACSLYRHQAVLMHDSRWKLRVSRQRLIFAAMTIPAVVLPMLLHRCLEPSRSIDRYQKNISASFASSLLDRADCYTLEYAIPLFVVGISLLLSIIMALYALILHTLTSLRTTSSLSETTRTHHMKMTWVLIMQALVPLYCVFIPCGVAYTAILTGMEGTLIAAYVIFAFSTHSFFESLVLISTTPIYRARLKQWTKLLLENLWIALFNGIAPAYLSCSLYRHQAVQAPDSRWYLRNKTQFLLISASISPFIILPCLLHLIYHTLASLRSVSTLSEQTRAHHATMTRVLISQATTIKIAEKEVVVHPNFCNISLSTIANYAIGVLARFVIIFYEIYDLPVSSQHKCCILGTENVPATH